ncbi:juvenile hormone acid O-methyltransferase-like [Aricia agestis]|uniref:juvenile hormone acid O-methyltransferase-like n=1 Tax=Aricia agestis TaxID=91739 RepID=UPI001C204EEF|nr:juvenile hormone acid O-methyltransferase-like [Aricia agestis]
MRKMSILAMTDPVLYNKYNRLQNRDNKRCLSENVARMTWRSGDRVLDIGSGDGSFTATELRRYLPDDVSELVGCDRSREMVDYANENFGGDGINFRVLEIGQHIPREFIGSFNHVFAFFSLHWVTDQRLALSQVYDILTEGGDCLLLIVGNFPAVFDVYKVFAQTAKWCRWVKRLDDNVLSPYHECDDPEEKLRKIGEEVGFKKMFVQCNQSTYKYDSVEDFKSMIVSINPFNIPEELCDEYLEEFVRVAKEHRYITDDLIITYTTNTFFGSK